MGDKDQHFNREESRVTVDEDANQVDNEEGKNARDIAGPSGCLLPGAVPKTNLQKTGLSKSENNIRHIITPKDVANALNSISKTEHQPNLNTININLNDLKIPPYAKVKTSKESALNDVRKLVASYFKHTNDAATVEAVNLRNISTTMHVGQDLHASNLVSQVHRNDDVTITIPLPNEVLLPNTPTKVHSDNKKKTGNISERSDFGIGARDSLSSIGSNVCRICMTRGKERLISPCNCKGSLANVHLTCLERWLNQVGRNHCELCGYSYPAIRTPRYTVLEALRLWFGNPRNRSHLQSDCLIFWLLSTVTAGLLTVCIVGTQYFVIEGNKFGKHRDPRKEEGIPHRITETAMNFFMAIVLCGYTVTVYLLWKEHYVTWNRWRRANVNVRLLLARDAS